MPRAIVSGEPGEAYTNESGTVLYQFFCNWSNTCGLCSQYDSMIGPSWGIPLHRGCRCKQVAIYPGNTSRPFTDFRATIADLDPAQRARVVGVANLKLIEQGVVKFEDVVTGQRVRDLREVVATKKLTIADLTGAGVGKAVAERAYATVHTPAHDLARQQRQELLAKVLAKGVSKDALKQALAERLAARVGIGAGPSGPKPSGIVPTPVSVPVRVDYLLKAKVKAEIAAEVARAEAAAAAAKAVAKKVAAEKVVAEKAKVAAEKAAAEKAAAAKAAAAKAAAEKAAAEKAAAAKVAAEKAAAEKAAAEKAAAEKAAAEAKAAAAKTKAATRGKTKADREAAQKLADAAADLARREAYLVKLAAQEAGAKAAVEAARANPGAGKVSRATLEDAIRGVGPLREHEVIAGLIKAHQSVATTSGSFQGMTDAETFHSVRFEGVTYHFHPLGDAPATFTPIVVHLLEMIGAPSLPPKLAMHTKDVYFTNQANSADPRWQVEYNSPNHVSAATGSHGTVVFYRGRTGLGTLAHEMGHNLATGTYNTVTPPAGGAYRAAMATGEPPVSEYAKNNPAEDFAEAVELFYLDPGNMRANYPERHAVLEALIR